MNIAAFMRAASVALLMTCAAHAAAAGACARKPMKPDAGAWLGEDTLVDGMPVTVMAVSYKDSPDEVARRWRAYWDDAGVPSRALRSRKGWLITAIENDCSYVLQLPAQRGADGMSGGLFSAMRLQRADLPAEVGARAMPLPVGGRVVSDTVSRDPMAVARTVVVDVDGSARGTHARFLSSLLASGWRVLADAGVPRAAGLRGGRAIALQKEGYKLDATFVPRGAATRAVINVSRTL